MDRLLPDPRASASADQGLKVSRFGQRDPAGTSVLDHRPGERMLRSALHAGGELQDLGLAPTIQRNHVRDCRPTLGQRAGLVEAHRVDRTRMLEMDSSLDQDPGPRGAGEPAHDRDRRRDHEGARAGHHQHRERPIDPCVPVAESRERWKDSE